MEQAFTLALNGAAVLFLWGLVWRSAHQAMAETREEVGKKVSRDYCNLQHTGLSEDLREIKQNQERIATALDEIKLSLARESGGRVLKTPIE